MALTADVVIIGGGVTGASIAYHLAARGMREVVVVDKSFVASGATARALRASGSTTPRSRLAE